jgi:hydrogenase maturation protease
VTAVRVIALGQPAAGDDGVGPAVLARLRARGAPPGVELLEAGEASALVEWARFPGTVVIVDALLGGRPGALLRLAAEDLEASALSPLSTHGLSVGGALALARSLAPGELSPRIEIVGIAIAAPDRWAARLSPPVAAAVDAAADLVLALAGAPLAAPDRPAPT